MLIQSFRLCCLILCQQSRAHGLQSLAPFVEQWLYGLHETASAIPCSTTWHQPVRALINLPFDLIFKRFPINLPILKGGNQRGNRACKHDKAFLLKISRTLALLLVLCKFISPALASPQDVQALKMIEREYFTKSQSLVDQSQSAVLQMISFWRQYQYDGKRGGFYRLRDFIRQNPDWPELHIIRQQLELTLNKDIPAKDIIDWFNENAPRSVKGLDAYGRALKSTGQHDTLKTVMQDWWANTLMPRQDQKYIYSRYKSYIPLSAHVRRLDKLLFNKQYTNARAVARVLGKGYPALTEARIALAAQKGGVDQYIARVPTSLKNDPGLAYERLRWRRKKERNDSAMEILLNPPAADSIINPKDWWRERHIIIRRLLKERRFIDAYRLAAAHQQPGGASLAQAEWLAGWLALRFADKPAEAYERFQSLHSWVKTPISKARAAYWAGRAADALKTGALAKQWYAEAAQYQTVFYGQKAGEKIGQHEALKTSKCQP